MTLPGPVQTLINEWSRFPGVGEKTARRMVFYLLRQEPEKIRGFGDAVLSLSKNIRSRTPTRARYAPTRCATDG